MKNRDVLRNIANNPGRQEDWIKYRRARNKCVKTVENSKI